VDANWSSWRPSTILDVHCAARPLTWNLRHLETSSTQCCGSSVHRVVDRYRGALMSRLIGQEVGEILKIIPRVLHICGGPGVVLTIPEFLVPSSVVIVGGNGRPACTVVIRGPSFFLLRWSV